MMESPSILFRKTVICKCSRFLRRKQMSSRSGALQVKFSNGGTSVDGNWLLCHFLCKKMLEWNKYIAMYNISIYFTELIDCAKGRIEGVWMLEINMIYPKFTGPLRKFR